MLTSSNQVFVVVEKLFCYTVTNEGDIKASQKTLWMFFFQILIQPNSVTATQRTRHLSCAAYVRENLLTPAEPVLVLEEEAKAALFC